MRFLAKLEIQDNIPKIITAHQDGTICFEEGREIRKISIEKSKIDELEKIILEANFFNLDKIYDPQNAEDEIAHTITVQINDKKHSVYFTSNPPPALEKISEAIKNLWPEKIKYLGFA